VMKRPHRDARQLGEFARLKVGRDRGCHRQIS
jgi:hypothetical protein